MFDKFNSYNIVYNDFKDKENDDYFMILDIPKIDLKKGIYSKESFKNNVDQNVTILNESLLPSEGTVILAAHSGNSSVSFFRNLNLLEIGDEVTVLYDNYSYKYIVDSYKIYDKKNIKFHTDLSEKKLILVTCFDDYKYLIFFANLST